MNLTKNFPITVSTTEKISDGIHIYKNGTRITYLSPEGAMFLKNGRKMILLGSEEYDKDYPERLIFNYNNCEKKIRTADTGDGYEMKVSWVNESNDVQEVGFNIKIYRNTSYVEIEYFYRARAYYTNLKPLFYAIRCDRKYDFIKIFRDDEIRGGVFRTYIKNEGEHKNTYKNCRIIGGREACDYIRSEAWYVKQDGSLPPKKVVEIKADFGKIEHIFKWKLVRYYLKDPKKDVLRIYLE